MADLCSVDSKRKLGGLTQSSNVGEQAGIRPGFPCVGGQMR